MRRELIGRIRPVLKASLEKLTVEATATRHFSPFEAAPCYARTRGSASLSQFTLFPAFGDMNASLARIQFAPPQKGVEAGLSGSPRERNREVCASLG